MNWLAVHTKQLLLALAVLTAVTVVAGGVTYVCVMVPVLPGAATVTVPDFSGENVRPDPEHFSVSVEYEYSDAPEGAVISQYPAAGARRKVSDGRPCRVTLILSRGQKSQKLPRLAGLDVNAAQSSLRAMGLEFELEEASGPAGQVVSTEPAEGAKVTPGQRVRLYVGNRSATVPELRGLSEAAARARLEAAGLTAARSEYVKSSRPAGTVTSQSATPGTTLPEGSSIVLTVSQGQ